MSRNRHRKHLARWTSCACLFLGLLLAYGPRSAGAQVPAGTPLNSGTLDTVSIDFTTFPNGVPIPQNVNGEYGVPGTTNGIAASNEFESLGVVFAPPLPGILVRVGGWLISSSPAFFGDIRMNFLVPVTSVTVDIIGSGLNISARLQAFNSRGALIGTVTHTYTGNTGLPSPFTVAAPPGETIASVVYNGGLNSAAAASIDTLTFTTKSSVHACLGSDRQVYDARADFLSAWAARKNPNGCWTYGWSKDLHGTLNRFPKASLSPINNGLEQMWYDPANNARATPSVARNSGGDYNDTNVTFLAGSLILNPGGLDGRGYAHVIWTAPRHGSYLVTSAFFSQQNSIDVDLNILVNRKLVFTDELTSDDTQHTFVKELRLAKNDTVDFAVGPNRNYVLHPGNTGFEAHIVRLTPTRGDDANKQDREGD